VRTHSCAMVPVLQELRSKVNACRKASSLSDQANRVLRLDHGKFVRLIGIDTQRRSVAESSVLKLALSSPSKRALKF